jgi:polysaccharide biosynthesis/export protein
MDRNEHGLWRLAPRARQLIAFTSEPFPNIAARAALRGNCPTGRRWLPPALALLASACSGPTMIDTGRVAITAADQLPAPTIADLARGQRPHLIGPFDRLSVELFGLPDLSRQVQVDANGQVSLPLVGTIAVGGRTPEEVAQLLTERFRVNHVRDPRVTVGVLETVSQTFAVDGEVRLPGVYPAAGSMTLMRAVARAQGTNEFARTNHVVVFRTVDGRQMAALYDLRAIRLGAYEDPPVYPQDVIVVGESQARRIFPQILQVAGFLLTPLVTILNNN